MFTIKINDIGFNEKKYVIDFLFKEYFGIDYEIVSYNENDTEIIFADKKIIIRDIFLNQVDNKWLEVLNLFKNPLEYLNYDDLSINVRNRHKSIPILFGSNKIKLNKETILFELDLIGSCFFMLSGYEEAINLNRDIHDRFLARYSISKNQNFILRPIVNEYAELLFSYLEILNPQLKRKKNSFKKLISVDVDQPYNPNIKNFLGIIRGTIKFFLQSDKTNSPLKLIYNYLANKVNFFIYDDDYNNFQWLIEKNTQVKNKVIFFIIQKVTNAKYDGKYSISEKLMRNLNSKIKSNQHEIGIHFSYETYNNANNALAEKNIFFSNEKIFQAKSRQHFLRWSSLITPRILNSVGIQKDYTVGYADHVGFRSGTCTKYKLYDLENRCELDTYEIPLIAMDVSLFGETYMNLSCENEILEVLFLLEDECRHFGGTYSILWHNNQLNSIMHREIYEKIIK